MRLLVALSLRGHDARFSPTQATERQWQHCGGNWGTESAGVNRHIVGDERVLQKRRSDSILVSSLVLFLARATVEAVIKERQREGIELAKRKGLYTGRKLSQSPERVARLRTRVAAGESKSKLAKTA
jgi:DNA invertase Pin-like site-specific DNA recombinase